MTELNALLALQELWPVRPSMYVSTLELSHDSLEPGKRWYVIGECDRNQPINALRTTLRSVRLIWRERPDVVITTGSLPMAIFCLVCKLFGGKVVWIDSISQIETISMSGRLIRPIADLFFVQWPDLAARNGETIYAGELI